MIFAKVDVTLPTHHRLLRIPKRDRAEALGVWLAALCYSRGNELNGFCPMGAIHLIARDKVVEQLIAVGLIARDEKEGEHGILILRYAEHNETKEEINARRAYDRERKSKFGRTQGQAESGTIPVAFRQDSERNPSGFPAQGIPDSDSDSGSDSGSPSRSAGESPRGGKDSAGARLNPEWLPSQKVLDWARERGIDASAHLGEFVDHWMAEPDKTARKADWDCTFRNRLRYLRDCGRAKPLRPALLEPLPPPTPEEKAQRMASAARLRESLKFDPKSTYAKEVGNGKF